MRKNENINKMLDEFISKVRNDDTENINRLVDDIFRYYGMNISDAINPVNTVALPFIYSVLKGYVQTIEKRFPDEVEIAECLDNTMSITIIVPKKYLQGGRKSAAIVLMQLPVGTVANPCKCRAAQKQKEMIVKWQRKTIAKPLWKNNSTIKR